MPLLDFNDVATFQRLYRCTGEDGQEHHFERPNKRQILGNDHWLLLQALNLQIGQRIALVGAGFGWVAEDWAAAGYTVIAIETSTWIHGNKAQHAVVTIYNEDGATNSSRNRIKQLLGVANNQKIDWAITEDVLPCLSDSECLQAANFIRQYATNVAHWVTPLIAGANQDPALNWKTLAQWKALMTPDLVVRRGSSEVL